MKRAFGLVVTVVLVLVVAACSGPGDDTASSGGAGVSASSSYSTKFPLPASVSNFTETANASINFQTKTSLTDTISFYRNTFAESGLTERSINTAITDTTFSLVFDGDPSGKAIVVQGADLGDGTTNVNIRYEDV